MKKALVLFFFANIIAVTFQAQNIIINPAGSVSLPSQQLKPGFFYNNTTAQANAIFDNSGSRYNSLRTFDIAYELRTSAGFSSFMSSLRSLKSLHESRAARTDIFIIQIMGLPLWLSSSTDTSRVDPNDVLRHFETVKPKDYSLWDSLVTAMAKEVGTWNFTPYFEFWNEPELHFWSGTEAEITEMYRHTAFAIKAGDINAKVGGFGMNGWANGIGWTMPPSYGFFPDSLTRQTSLLSHLIDTVAAYNIPLDFISWHHFGGFWKPIEWAAGYFTAKLNGYGLNGVRLLITEYNTGSSSRETPLQTSQFIRCYREMERAKIDGHCMSSFQDFSYNPASEFFGEWGAVSRGGLAKPVYIAIALLDYLQKDGSMLNVQTTLPLTVYSSLHGDTLRTLVSNHVQDPKSAGYEQLLYGDYNVNLTDLINAGYTATAKIDSTIAGLLAPTGPQNMQQAFAAANAAFTYSLAHYYQNTSIQMKVEGNSGIIPGRLVLIDSKKNNIIYKYDSLLNAGYTRTQAVNSLYPAQKIEFDSITLSGSTFSFSMEPNAVALVEFFGVPATTGFATPDKISGEPRLYPNPSTGMVALYGKVNDPYSVNVYSMDGRKVYTREKVFNRTTLDLSYLPNGIYIAETKSRAGTVSRSKLVID